MTTRPSSGDPRPDPGAKDDDFEPTIIDADGNLAGGALGSDSVMMAHDPKQLSGKLRTRIVVLGGGFAGVYTAKHLASVLGKREDVDIELLSQENYQVYQPLLPEVAAGGIGPTHAVTPIREMIRGVNFRLCNIDRIDFANRRVRVTQGEGRKTIGVRYDHLVFCLGKVSNFSSMPGVAEHGMGMKTLGDAFELRNHVIKCLELADAEPDPKTRQSLLSFVVAGGGFSGVETVGELCELVDRSLEYFPNIPKKDVLFKLVHSDKEILPEMPPKLRDAARKVLEKRQIELVLSDRVRSCSPDRVYLKSGRILYTYTFVCTVGNAPNPVAKDALTAGGFEEARFQGKPTGLFATDDGLQCRNKPGYWAVGDCAGVPSPTGQGLCPPTAQFAIRQAKVCAQNIAATIDHKPLRKFQFKALGMLASLGQRSAVADLMGVHLTGFLAWMMWRFIYLMKLPGFARRIRVGLDWFIDLFLPRDLTQLSTSNKRGLSLRHYEPGEVIIAEGQIARELFLIKSGQVEVWQERKLDRPEKVIAKLGPQEIFGERAMLNAAKYTSSVRTVTAVDLLALSREEFNTILDQFKVLKDHYKATQPHIFNQTK